MHFKKLKIKHTNKYCTNLNAFLLLYCHFPFLMLFCSSLSFLLTIFYFLYLTIHAILLFFKTLLFFHSFKCLNYTQANTHTRTKNL